jgi:tetratricopeptide (TPR) repeat protein
MESVDVLLDRATEARRASLLGEARDHAERAETVARHTDTPEALARALTVLAQVDRDQRRPEAARPHYEEAVALYRSLGDELRVAHTIRHLGELHTEAGRLAEADACLHEALEIYRAHDDAPTLDLANAVRPMAILREEQGHEAEARDLWTEARSLYAEQRIQEGIQECDEHLARLAGF